MLKKIMIVFALVATVTAQAKKPKAKPADATATHANRTAGGTNETIALKGGRLLTITHGVIENGVLVRQNVRITDISGSGTAIPSGAKVIDATGMTVYPGL